MSNDAETTTLTELLDTIKEDVSSGTKNKVTLGKVTRVIKQQGFGALLLAPAGILILPVGAIPGVPIACSVFITLIAGQIVIGREEVWLPKRLRTLSMSRSKFIQTVRRAKPFAKKIDTVVQARFEVLTTDFAHRIVASICIALAIPMAFIGFIPFIPMLLALPILFFSLGMCVKDGFLTLCGFGAAAALIFAVPCLVGLCF